MNIKKTLQAPLRLRQTGKYEERIREQTVSYHDWILKKEKQERRGMCREEQMPSVACIPFDRCGRDYDPAGEQAEILIFHGPDGKPDGEDVALIAAYFARHPETVIAYGDEDERLPEEGGRRTNPWLKPDWSPDTLFSFFYFGNLFAVRREKVGHILWLGSESWKENIYDFCLKASEGASGAGHVDSVVFHNAVPIEPWGMEEAYAGIKRQAYIRRGWPQVPSGKISIIIPSKDHPGVLSVCIHSILEASSYRDFEIIVIDNGSSEKNRNRIGRMLSQMTEECRFRYVYEPMEFNFSRMCNRGAQLATGDYILLLNDDIEIIQEDWLERMLEKARLPHVGAVGVKLLYPESRTIQHAGITNIRLGPAHKLQYRSDKDTYYFQRNRLALDVLGVTGACLMVKKELYEAAGGLKEDLRVAFNDVEFCFQLYDMGYVNVVRNDVALYHHESLSRGLDDSVEKLRRLHQELNLLYELHPSLYGRDPYYHRYLVKDVLDHEFYAGNRYEYEDRVDHVTPVPLREGLRPEWYNEVLRMGVEFCGDMRKWQTGKGGGGDYFIQGWCYALQVDNSQYRFSVLLKPMGRGDGPMEEGVSSMEGKVSSMERKESSMERGECSAEDGAALSPEERYAPRPGAVWKLPVSRQYRPDIRENLGHLEKVSLTGVCLQFARTSLPEGEYRIGFLWEDCCSRQKLYQWTAETMRIVHGETVAE